MLVRVKALPASRYSSVSIVFILEILFAASHALCPVLVLRVTFVVWICATFCPPAICVTTSTCGEITSRSRVQVNQRLHHARGFRWLSLHSDRQCQKKCRTDTGDDSHLPPRCPLRFHHL
jgi:hypothetical protein